MRDYGIYTPKTTLAALEDMAELAARLGSIVTFDRKGDVVWLDDFESGLSKWLTHGTGTDKAIEISSESSRDGGFSAKLTPGNAEDNYAYIHHRAAMPVKSKIGLEFSFTMELYVKILEARLELYDGTHGFYTRIRFDDEEHKLYYFNSEGNPVEFASEVTLFRQDKVFHTLKFVVDFEEEKYDRCILNNTQYDLSTYAIQKTEVALAPLLAEYIYVYNGADGLHPILIDNVILTQNEP